MGAVTVNDAGPVIGAMGSLKAAVMTALLMGTPVALGTGATAVTVGAAMTLVLEGSPRMGALFEEQPSARAPARRGVSQGVSPRARLRS
jgi:hypothetical protein